MASHDALRLVLEQAERERDAALALYQQAQQRAAQARAQAQDLLHYRGDYDARWQQQFREGGAGIETLATYQGFGTRLGEAIAQQGQLAQTLEARVEAARQALAARETRVASVRKLIERRQAEQLLQQTRLEQKASDEFAQRASARQPPRL